MSSQAATCSADDRAPLRKPKQEARDGLNGADALARQPLAKEAPCG